MIGRIRLSTWQLVLVSTGSMFGAGWLFSPYYGFEIAGIGVLIAWIITAALIIIISLSFIEIYGLLPILGSVTRFIGVTHNRPLAFIFMSLSWLGYVGYLPLEAQSAIQYLGFWYSSLVYRGSSGVELSGLGIALAIAIIFGLTWLNTIIITNIAKINSVVSIAKIMIPICAMIALVISFGKWDNIVDNFNAIAISPEAILLAITTGGLVFAFTGFNNGLILSNYAKHPKRAAAYSTIVPTIFVGTIYFCLSLTFIACMPANKALPSTAVAPLLGLVTLLNAHILLTVLFIDAISAPLGTANVLTALTGRILYALGRDFFPKSFLVLLNKHRSPYMALWLNAIVGICFLLPLPTWKELVTFLSSVVVLVYIAGPIALILFRQAMPEENRVFKVKAYKLIGYLGFACCSLMLYWSGMNNLFHLNCFLILTVVGYGIVARSSSIVATFIDSWYLLIYIGLLTLISYLRTIGTVEFPLDNLFVVVIGLITCKVMLMQSSPTEQIIQNMIALKQEIKSIQINH